MNLGTFKGGFETSKPGPLKVNLIYMEVPKLIKDCIIGIDSQEKLKKLINTEAKL